MNAPALLDALAARVDSAATGRVRVLVDGPPPADPGGLAGRLVPLLRVLGRPALGVAAADFLRPASLRLERGREDPDELLDTWLDVGAVRREVLDPVGPGGSGLVLPRLWDAVADRAFRAQRWPLPERGVVLLSGSLLLGRGLPAELTVHLRMSAAALARALSAEQHWTLPAHRRYEREHDPVGADVVVLADHPERPALLEAR